MWRRLLAVIVVLWSLGVVPQIAAQDFDFDRLTLTSALVGIAYDSEEITPQGGTAPYTFSISDGALPDGLTLSDDGSTARITGTPTTRGRTTFTLSATDGTLTGSREYTLLVGIFIEPATLPNGAAGTAYDSGPVPPCGVSGPYTFDINSGALPSGLLLSDDGSTARITGTPTTPGVSNFTLQVTDSNSVTGLQVYTLTINNIPLQPTTLPDGRAGTAYNSGPLTPQGGTGPYTFNISDGALPGGLTINISTGAITGTPTTPGRSTFTVQVTDSQGVTGSRQYTLTVGVFIDPPTLPDAPIGVLYSVQLQAVASAGNPAFTVATGALPPGINLLTNGLLAGTPSEIGSYNFTVRVVDNDGNEATRAYTLVVTGGALTLGPTGLPAAIQGVFYTTQLTTSGGTAPYTYELADGTLLPPGLALNAGTGEITGTPSAAGRYDFTIRVRDSAGRVGGRPYIGFIVRGALIATPAVLQIAEGGPGASSILTLGSAPTADVRVSLSGGTQCAVAPSTVTFNASNWQTGVAILITAVDDLVIEDTQSCNIRAETFSTDPIYNNLVNLALIAVLVQDNDAGVPGAVTPTLPPGVLPPLPTVTPIPTATPIPALSGSVSAEVGGIALRTGPYLGATLIGGVTQGQTIAGVLAISFDEGGEWPWYFIDTGTITGWASGRYLIFNREPGLTPLSTRGSIFDSIDDAPDVGVVGRLGAFTDMRRRPSPRTAILQSMPPGTVVAIIGRTRQNGGDFWYHIRYTGQVGWIVGALVAERPHTGNVPIR